ncbi:MAG: MerR family transcriptional regulator [Chloroflexota bacterium]
MPRAVAPPEQNRLSLGPAARMLGVDPDTLRRWADEGRIEAFTTPGGHRRFDRLDIERLCAARHPGPGTPLAAMGATPDRMSRAYRRSYDSAAPEDDVRAAVPAQHRDAFRADGRGLVASLVAYLDAEDDAARERAEAGAAALTQDLGRRLAAAGLSLTESVGLFVTARRPFLAELGAIARRRALPADRLSAMFEDASALLDRLLIRLVSAHQAAC